MTSAPVLIVGAGPTGLVLALSLARRGVPFRIIDDNPAVGLHSRAMVVHARTLEFYRQYGIADALLAQGVKIETVHLRRGGADGAGHEFRSFHFGDMGGGLSPYPFLLAYPQDDHERFLSGVLERAGHTVERRTRLLSFTQTGTMVRAEIALPDGGRETVEASYVCGCDGAHSAVRSGLGLGFEGGTYPQKFFVADVKIAGGFKRDFYVNLAQNLLLLMLPVRTSGMQRLIGLVPHDLVAREEIGFDDLRARVEKLLDIAVTDVNWFSVYLAHHKVADRFGIGRVFVLGDAAHVHSPAGGQGMNTGIGDAINLGWKLADVICGRADGCLLDTYEHERIAFARTLVATTDSAFRPVVADGWLGDVTRRFVAPLAATLVTSIEGARRRAFKTLSQIQIEYRTSSLSSGKAGRIAGGDRLPWIAPSAGEADNFEPLRALDWQIHVYGQLDESLAAAARATGLAIHQLAWSDGAAQAGLARDAVYLIRPDGYVAFASEGADADAALSAYIKARGLRFAPTQS